MHYTHTFRDHATTRNCYTMQFIYVPISSSGFLRKARRTERFGRIQKHTNPGIQCLSYKRLQFVLCSPIANSNDLIL